MERKTNPNPYEENWWNGSLGFGCVLSQLEPLFWRASAIGCHVIAVVYYWPEHDTIST